MTWADLSTFLSMGGHGAYVWGSVAAVLFALAAELVALSVRDNDNASRGELPETSEETSR